MSHLRARHFKINAVTAKSSSGSYTESKFLLERLLLFSRVWAIILFGYYLASNVLFRFEAAAASDWLVRPDNIALSLSIGLELVVWLGIRWTSPSERVLRLIDVCGAVALCLITSLGSLLEPRLHDLRTSVLALIFTLIARSVVIPSHALRTLWIGLSATLPVVVAEVLIAMRGDAPARHSIAEASCIALWCLGGVAMSTGASKVIFGLRREVRTARRLG